MSKIRANFISSKNDNKAVEFTSGIVVGGAVTATNFDFNAEVYNVGTGASISNPANNELALGTNNTEKVRITSAGNVGIGIEDPNQNLHIHSSGTSYVRFTDESSGTGGTDGAIFGLDHPHLYAWNYEAGDFVVATNAIEKFRVKSDGNVEINDGNLVIGTSGHGIDFSITGDGSGTVSSELLDEYEEGFFTPTIVNGFSSANLQYKAGRYTRIGNSVYCDFYIRFNTGATANGTPIKIGGLPFNISSLTYGTPGTTGQLTRGGGGTTFQNLNSGDGNITFYGAAPQSYFSCYRGGTEWATVTSSGGANGAYIIGIFQFHAD